MSAPERLTGDLRRLYGHLSRRRRWQLAGLVVLMVGNTMAEMATLGAVLPFLALLADPSRINHYGILRDLFSRFGAGPGDMVFWSAMMFAAIALVAAIVRMTVLWAAYRFAFGLGANIGGEVYLRTLYRPYTWHVSRNSAEILAGMNKVDNVIFSVINQLMVGSVAAMMSIAIIAMLLAIDPRTALIAVAGFTVLYGIITVTVRRKLRANGKIFSTSQTRRLQAVQEGLGGIRDVLLDGTQPVYHQRFVDLDYAMRRAQAANALISEAPRVCVEGAGMVLIVAIAYGLTRHGGLTVALPVLGALALGAQKLLPQMQTMYQTWSQVNAYSHHLHDVLALLDTPIPPEYAVRRPTRLAIAGRRTPMQPLVALRDIGFQYAADSAKVLNNVNLSIAAGERIGVVGPTGSGKSTLIDLIMGLLPPTEGQIEIEGQPLTPENRIAWQARLAHVPQAIFLSDVSVTENIAFGIPPEEIDVARVEHAARQAQLADFIESLPQGYQTRVGERGVRLSGGQRQRIGLARALYKQADVLVLDEATSALDDATEKAVMDAIRLLHSEMTVLMIAHRISTLRNCDRIIQFMPDGAVNLVHYDALFQSTLKVHAG